MPEDMGLTNKGFAQAVMENAGQRANARKGCVAVSPSGQLAVTTHLGTVGLLHDRGVVAQVQPNEDGSGSTCHYTRSSGARIVFHLPSPHHVNIGDVLLVKSLTMPDGGVVPVAVRMLSDPQWVQLQDVDAVVETYAAGASRFIRWTAGLGSLAGVAAVMGVVVPVTGLAAAGALAISIGLLRRDRRDRASIGRLLA